MSLSILTDTEAKMLRALPQFDSTVLYQLASPALLTPSEVRAVVSQLVEKRLAETAEDRKRVRLTDKGRRVRRLLERPEKQRQQEDDRVLIVSFDEAKIGEFARVASDDAELDRELEEAIQKSGRVTVR